MCFSPLPPGGAGWRGALRTTSGKTGTTFSACFGSKEGIVGVFCCITGTSLLLLLGFEPPFSFFSFGSWWLFGTHPADNAEFADLGADICNFCITVVTKK